MVANTDFTRNKTRTRCAKHLHLCLCLCPQNVKDGRKRDTERERHRQRDDREIEREHINYHVHFFHQLLGPKLFVTNSVGTLVFRITIDIKKHVVFGESFCSCGISVAQVRVVVRVTVRCLCSCPGSSRESEFEKPLTASSQQRRFFSLQTTMLPV